MVTLSTVTVYTRDVANDLVKEGFPIKRVVGVNGKSDIKTAFIFDNGDEFEKAFNRITSKHREETEKKVAKKTAYREHNGGYSSITRYSVKPHLENDAD